MSAALMLWAFAAAVLILMFVVGFRLLAVGLRLLVWMFTTTAGWITFGVLLVIYIFFW